MNKCFKIKNWNIKNLFEIQNWKLKIINMKITVNQYAKTLYTATKEKSRKEIDRAVFNLIKILQKNRQLNLFSKISQKFSEIWNKENGIIEAEVTSCEKLRNDLSHQASRYIKEKYQAKEVVLHNIIDEKIQGGIIIQVGDEILDASVKQKINLLRNVLTK
jgi:F-type H+-transporting ATPase subunit delta